MKTKARLVALSIVFASLDGVCFAQIESSSQIENETNLAPLDFDNQTSTATGEIASASTFPRIDFGPCYLSNSVEITAPQDETGFQWVSFSDFWRLSLNTDANIQTPSEAHLSLKRFEAQHSSAELSIFDLTIEQLPLSFLVAPDIDYGIHGLRAAYILRTEGFLACAYVATNGSNSTFVGNPAEAGPDSPENISSLDLPSGHSADASVTAGGCGALQNTRTSPSLNASIFHFFALLSSLILLRRKFSTKPKGRPEY